MKDVRSLPVAEDAEAMSRWTTSPGRALAALAMAYKLLIAAQARWRRFKGHELVADCSTM